MSSATRRARALRSGLIVLCACAAPASGQDPAGAAFGSRELESFSYWIAGMRGDVDGDGVPDIATCSYGPYWDYSHSPQLAVISGATMKRVWQVDATFVTYASYGDFAAPVGDADGDGIPDLATIEQNSAGKLVVLLRSGVDGHVVTTITTFAHNEFNRVLRDIGDVDGDGVRDLALVRFAAPSLTAISSKTGSVIWTRGLPAGTSAFDLAELGDADGDGVSDLITGDASSATIRSGATGLPILTVGYAGVPGACSLGLTVTPLGDVDGDGIPDFAATGWRCLGGNQIWALSGASGSVIYRTGSSGYSDPWGDKVRAIGDVDGDGVTDLLVGFGALYGHGGGVVRLLSGASGSEIDRCAPLQHHSGLDEPFGFTVAGCGDLDGDGLAEFCIGDYYYTQLDTRWIGALLVYNRKAPDPAAGVNALIVDAHGNGAYATIQDAVNNASDGDLILVRPGLYPGFTSSKRVMIGSTSLPASIDGPVTFDSIAPGSAPAGMREVFTVSIAMSGPGGVEVKDCSGEVVLDRVRCGEPGTSAYSSSIFLIERSPNVAMTECVTSCQAGLVITDSTVRAADLQVGDDYPAENGDGAPAITATNSTLVVARPEIRGGRGGSGVCDWIYHYWKPPHDGGPAILADGSTVTLLGSGSDYVIGGNGGYPPIPCDSTPGNGADGIVLANGADVTISRVSLSGGTGNTNGADWSGNGTLTRLDMLPHLRFTDPLRIGQSTALALDSVEPGNVLSVVSTVGGFVPLKNFVGPPLSVLPGPGFLIASLGATDAAGQLSLPATLPHDVTLVGLQLEIQCAVFANSGTNYLTNAVPSIIGL